MLLVKIENCHLNVHSLPSFQPFSATSFTASPSSSVLPHTSGAPGWLVMIQDMQVGGPHCCRSGLELASVGHNCKKLDNKVGIKIDLLTL